jgi:C-methyltransferase C-terminal domain/Putative zinc binding domain/Methyltransferase domain
MGEVTACGICGSGELSLVLDLGEQPLPEHVSRRRYPLRLVECGACTLVQLDYIVDQHELFPAGHKYATGNTKFNQDHFSALAREVAEGLESGDLVCDVAANDGTLINAYRAFRGDLRRIAIEPTDQSWKCHVDVTYQEFFGADLARQILAEHGPARAITACNVIAHVPDLHDFTEGLQLLLADDGTLVVEAHDVTSITDGLQVDSVYAEHLYYYSVATLSRLLAMHGLTVTRAMPIATQGGSIRVYARKRKGDLALRAGQVLATLRHLLEDVTAGGDLVYGIGATTRATPLIFASGIAGLITCVCEVSSSEKIGLMMPGTQIRVVDESRLIEDQPEYALIFSYHIAASLMPKLRAMGYRGKFILPLPEPRITDE